MTVEDIAQRVADNRAQFEKKFETRKAKQDDYYLNLKKSVSNMSGSQDIDDTTTPTAE